MTTKLKGSRLETEVDKARTDGNWKRLTDLITSMKAKHSGMEDMVDLVEAELLLEGFLEQQGEVLRPREENMVNLRKAEQILEETVKEKANNQGTVLEAHLLLAKLHYTAAQYQKALKDIERSGMELGTTPFRTLRALRLVAEAYAIKGLSIEATEPISDRIGTPTNQKALYCFEKAAELAISFVSELEKNMLNQVKGGTAPVPLPPPPSGIGGKHPEKIGDLLECCLERVAQLRVRENQLERKSGQEGIEWYRRIITCLGDKSTGERLQQKLSKQLAELLIRSAPPHEGRTSSQALHLKNQDMSFYTGSQKSYFSPSSRTEEILLLLLISEVLSTREVVLSRNDELSTSRTQSLRNAKTIYNLLTLVLSTLRQYQLLSNIYERAMKFANQDSHLWQQLAHSLLCRGRWQRAARVLDQCIAVQGPDAVLDHMLAAQLHIQHFAQYDTALEHARKATALCGPGTSYRYLRSRCLLLEAIAEGQKAQCQPGFEAQRPELKKVLLLLEHCVQEDPHDYLALYYTALYNALARDLESARDACRRSLDLHPDQPAAIMLLALIFTADKDMKGALELVISALREFPSHYGLLVLRLHLERKLVRVEETLDTCCHLLDFWKKRETSTTEEDRTQLTMSAADGQSMLREGSQKAGTPSIGRDLASGAPMFAGPLGIGLSAPSLNGGAGSQSGHDMSVVDSGVPASEAGAPSSTTGSLGGSGASAATWARFRAQANMWTWLAELFLAEDRLSDVTPCIEQAVAMFPQAYHALYLKGRLQFANAKKATDLKYAAKLRADAKASFLSALAFHPSHGPSLVHLAHVYVADENFVMADHMFRELVRNDSMSCEWWQELGQIMMRRGYEERALQCFVAAGLLDHSTPLLPFSAIPLVFPSSFQ